MKRLVLSTLALSFFCLGINAQLKNITNKDVVEKIKTANASIETIQCKFKQTKEIAMVNNPVVSDGDFYFTKPDQLGMKYTNGEVMIINKDNVSIGKKGKVRNVKSKNKQVEALASTLLACMCGDVSKLNGTLEKMNDGAKEISFFVKVKFSVGKGHIEKLELVYDKKDMTVKSMKMIEADGSFTLYELQTKTLNKKIDPKVYEQSKKSGKN